MKLKHFLWWVSLFTLALVSAILLISGCNSSTSLEERIPALEETMTRLLDEALIPGISIAVIRDGDLFWSGQFGLKKSDGIEPVTEATLFEACSLSKPVFAFAVLRFMEEGKIDLDHPLMEYVDEDYVKTEFLRGEEIDPRMRKITARMVLSHSPGFPNWRRKNPIQLNFEPGEKFSYSGEGFVFLQKVVEKISGQPLNEWMKTQVFIPLKMRNSSYIWLDEFEGKGAFPHNHLGVPLKMRKMKRANAAASLYTTASDYARFLLAVAKRSGLSNRTVKALSKAESLVENLKGGKVSWGLGFGLEEARGSTSIWHWGDNMNFRCFFLYSLNRNDGLVYFCNSKNGLSITGALLDHFLGGKHPVVNSRLLSSYERYDSPVFQLGSRLAKVEPGNFETAYTDILKDNPGTELWPERSLNQLGYDFMGNKQLEPAIFVFTLNSRIYPASANVWDSLAEAHLKAGNRELAVKFYRKTLLMNPDNDGARQQLEKLREKG